MNQKKARKRILRSIKNALKKFLRKKRKPVQKTKQGSNKLNRAMARRNSQTQFKFSLPSGKNSSKGYSNYYKNQSLRRQNPNIRKINNGKVVAEWSKEQLV